MKYLEFPYLPPKKIVLLAPDFSLAYLRHVYFDLSVVFELCANKHGISFVRRFRTSHRYYVFMLLLNVIKK